MESSAALGPAIGEDAAEIVERVRPSLVEIRTPGAGAGAGVIWRGDGIVITNHHVAPGPRAEVILADGRRSEGSVVLRDPDHDLALLRISAPGLSPIDLADARSLRPGSLVLAVGHPFGMKGAVSLGVISRPPAPAGDRRWIVADVLLGPGNSGGPLLDAHGRLVGINAMVVGGRALAIPSDLAEALVARVPRVEQPDQGRASAA